MMRIILEKDFKKLQSSAAAVAEYLADEEDHFNDTDDAVKPHHIWNDVKVLRDFSNHK